TTSTTAVRCAVVRRACCCLGAVVRFTTSTASVRLAVIGCACSAFGASACLAGFPFSFSFSLDDFESNLPLGHSERKQTAITPQVLRKFFAPVKFASMRSTQLGPRLLLANSVEFTTPTGWTR